VVGERAIGKGEQIASPFWIDLVHISAQLCLELSPTAGLQQLAVIVLQLQRARG
jgi:hypothetical protein